MKYLIFRQKILKIVEIYDYEIIRIQGNEVEGGAPHVIKSFQRK